MTTHFTSYILNNVRSIVNTGIIVNGTTCDPCYSRGWFNTKPNILVNGLTCYIDYTDTYNNSDRVLLNRIFSTLPVGTSVYVNPVEYYDDVKSIRTYVGGTFTYASTFNSNKCIVGNITSGFTATSPYTFFDKDNFVKPPQFTMGYTGGATSANYIQYSLPNKKNTPFSTSGVLGSVFGFEEYIEVSGSTLNSGKIKTYGMIQLKDNQEVLYATGTLANENLFTSNTTLNYYIRGNSNVSTIEKPQNALGAYTIYDSNLVKKDCYEMQNEYQALLRAQNLGSNTYGYWLPCQNCDNLEESSSFALNGNKTLYYANSVYFSISQTVITSTSGPNTPPYTLYTNRSASGIAAAISSLTFSSITGNLKLDLSHPTLQGWSVDIFTDVGLSQRLTTSYYRSGLPGFDQSYIMLLYGQYLPKLLYCVFTGPSQIAIPISLG